MSYFHNKSRVTATTALFLILAVILTLFSGVAPALQVQAAENVTIKTQKAADNIKNGIRGIDVSKYQGTINWKRVATDDVKFAMCRATYGTDIDPTFVTNAKGANENGLYVGAYHYARIKDSSSVKKEAAAFIKQLKKVTLTYPVVLDIENHYGLSKSKLSNLAIQFLEILKENGYKVIIYSYQNFFTGHLNLAKFKDYDIWVANYIEKPKDIDYVMWQHTSYGTVKGISGRVDINIALKSLSTKRRATSTATSTSSGSKSVKQTKASPYATIVDFLNDHYAAGLSVDANHTIDEINRVIYSALQLEINKQLGGTLIIDGVMTEEAAKMLSDITFTKDQTQGRITTLIQSKLYFKRYTESINGVYDSVMMDALKAMQTAYRIEANGQMDYATWAALLGV